MQYYLCYPKGKYKAVTLSYDDGKISDKRLVEILNRHELKGTFHLNGGLFSDLTKSTASERIQSTEVKTLYQNHEVACHTYTHPTIARCPLPVVVDELMKDRQQLEALVGYPVQGLSYPNGSFTKEIKQLLPALDISYSRTVGSSHDYQLPTDWYEWQATCHHNHNLMKHAKQFVDLERSQCLYLFYVWGHSFEFDNDNNWSLIEEFSQFIGQRQDIWYCTNIEFQRYITQGKQVVFSVDGKTAFNLSYESIWFCLDQRIVELVPGMNEL